MHNLWTILYLAFCGLKNGNFKVYVKKGLRDLQLMFNLYFISEKKKNRFHIFGKAAFIIKLIKHNQGNYLK